MNLSKVTNLNQKMQIQSHKSIKDLAMTTSGSQSLQEDTPYSHSSKPKINLRSTFISPELAYNNEKIKLFEKIGYTK